MWRISGEVGVLVMYRFIAASPLAALCLGCWERGGVSNKPIVDRFKSKPNTKPQRRVIEAREATPLPIGLVAIVPRNGPGDLLYQPSSCYFDTHDTDGVQQATLPPRSSCGAQVVVDGLIQRCEQTVDWKHPTTGMGW
jgi:hypothetical protein